MLAPFTAGRSKKQVALSTGYAGNGGGFNNALGSLRSKGLITKGEPIMATVLGYEALDGQWEELPTGPALLEQWKAKGSQIGGKAGAAILDALAAVWPASMSKEDLAAATGYVPTGGGFNNVLGRLRTLELIERGEPRLADELAGD